MTAPKNQDVPRRAPRANIAILGGGMGSLAAAWELTSYPGWQDDYAITVYQPGWRLGGKTRTGRGAHGRVEELGIHVLQGWYHNAFRVVREVFAARERLGLAEGTPFRGWRDAFSPDHSSLIVDRCPRDGRWRGYSVTFPANDLLPGEGAPPTVAQALRQMMVLSTEFLAGMVFPRRRGWGARTYRALLSTSRVSAVIDRLIDGLRTTRVAADDTRATIQLLRAATALLRPVVRRLAGDIGSRASPLANVSTLLEIAVATVDGLLADAYDGVTGAFHLERLDRWDFREWLRRHGVSPRAAHSGYVQLSYLITFAYPVEGDPERGRLSACTALRFLLRAAGYRGAMFWKLRAGTGDTLVMPLYQVLAARGVRFEFFHRVEALRLDAAQRTVEELVVTRQARVRGERYEPATSHRGLATWPAQPRWEELEPDDARRLRGALDALEGADPSRGGETRTLRRGEDFDLVVLGIPVAAQRSCCAELSAASPRWRDHLALKTAPSLNVQLWLKEPPRALGLRPEAWGMEPNQEAQTVTYQPPINSWIDMTEVLKAEGWGAAGPRGLVYLTGRLEELEPGPDLQGRAQRRAHTVVTEYLRANLGDFFPAATSPARPNGLELGRLHAPEPGDPLAQQHIRANICASDRYTLSLPGTARRRLAPQGSGFANLALAGDWTDTGLNVGCVEAAVTAGLLAGQHLRDRLGLASDRPVFTVDASERP